MGSPSDPGLWLHTSALGTTTTDHILSPVQTRDSRHDDFRMLQRGVAVVWTTHLRMSDSGACLCLIAKNIPKSHQLQLPWSELDFTVKTQNDPLLQPCAHHLKLYGRSGTALSHVQAAQCWEIMWNPLMVIIMLVQLHWGEVRLIEFICDVLSSIEAHLPSQLTYNSPPVFFSRKPFHNQNVWSNACHLPNKRHFQNQLP